MKSGIFIFFGNLLSKKENMLLVNNPIVNELETRKVGSKKGSLVFPLAVTLITALM